jgi:hypothetical protein
VVRETISAAVMLLVASAADARQVEMISFPVYSTSPDDAAPESAKAHWTGMGVSPGQLAAEFQDMPRSAPAFATDGMSIPLWLQTGMAPSARNVSRSIALPLGLAQIPPGCGDTSFRRRPDLPSSTEARRARLFPLVAQVACEAGIPVGLFDALVVQESRYQVGAFSPKGAAGLTQLMPGTARELGVRNSWDALENLRGGALYLRRQINEFGRVDLALAAYNAGPGRVRARRRVPAIAETLNYVATITRAWNRTSTMPFGGSADDTHTLRRSAELVRFAAISGSGSW